MAADRNVRCVQFNGFLWQIFLLNIDNWPKKEKRKKKHVRSNWSTRVTRSRFEIFQVWMNVYSTVVSSHHSIICSFSEKTNLSYFLSFKDHKTLLIYLFVWLKKVSQSKWYESNDNSQQNQMTILMTFKLHWWPSQRERKYFVEMGELFESYSVSLNLGSFSCQIISSIKQWIILAVDQYQNKFLFLSIEIWTPNCCSKIREHLNHIILKDQNVIKVFF